MVFGTKLRLVLLAGCFLTSLSSMATPPTPPMTIGIDEKEMSGKLDKQLLNIPVQLIWHEDFKSADLTVLIRPLDSFDARPNSGSVYKKGIDAKRNEKISLDIPLKLDKPAGSYELTIKILGRMEKENGFSDKVMRYLVIDKNANYRLIPPKQFVREQRERREAHFKDALRKNPESPNVRLLHENAIKVPTKALNAIKPHTIKNQLSARPVGPSESIKRYIDDRSGQAWSPEDPITVRGRLVYLDFDGVWRPLVNVSINLYDEDTGFDDHLGTTVTDWNGDWSFSVNNDDGWGADGRDLYYTFKLGNTRIRVQDCDGIDSTYSWQSSVHDNLNDGTVLDFGSETGGSNINSMQIWNMLNLAWNHASTVGGRDPGFVDSCFPEGSGARWDRFWEEIDIPGSDNDAPDVVTHEYGHAVMYYAYGSDNPSPGGSHGFGDDAQDPSLAWSEGWGTGFMLSLRPDGRYNWSEGDGGRDIENFSDAGNRDGNRNEGRVAAAINDMLDSANDNNGGNQDRGRDGTGDTNNANRVVLESMLNDTLWGSWHDDFETFWASLSGELSGTTRVRAQEIMNYNHMDVDLPSSCIATKVVALESASGESLLEGLRRFRDNGLKGFNGGQHLINSYYRNSPELALLLIKDAALRKDAGKLMEHFSRIGYLLSSHQEQKKSASSKEVLIDNNTAEHIRSVMERIRKNASKELLQDMEPLDRILVSVAGLDLQSLQMKLGDIKSKHPKVHREQLKQFEFNEPSKKAMETKDVKTILQKYNATIVDHK